MMMRRSHIKIMNQITTEIKMISITMISEEVWLIKITEDQMAVINIKRNTIKMTWETTKTVSVRSEGLVQEITIKGPTTPEETMDEIPILIEVVEVVIVTNTNYQFNVKKMSFKDLNTLSVIEKEDKFLLATCLSA